MRRVAVDEARRRFDPERLLDDVGNQRPVGQDFGQLLRRGQQVEQGAGRRALRGLDGTEHDHGGIGEHGVGVEQPGNLGERPGTAGHGLPLIQMSEPTRRYANSDAVLCVKKKKDQSTQY